MPMTRPRPRPDDLDTRQCPYPMELEDASEAARLTILSRVVTRSLDDLVPPEVGHLPTMQVLDVGCGPGGWVHDVAYSYPKAEVVGIDLSQTMLGLARSGADAQGLNNAFFERVDATQLLPFSDGTFDLVQARFCNSFLLEDTWPEAVREWVRVTRPGGFVRILDADGLGQSNDPAFQQFEQLLRAAWQRDAQGRVWPIGPRLAEWLRQAGIEPVREQAHVLDFSAPVSQEDQRAYETQYERNASMSEVLSATCTLLAPYLLRQTGFFPETLHALSQQLAVSMRQPPFRGQIDLVEVVGACLDPRAGHGPHADERSPPSPTT